MTTAATSPVSVFTTSWKNAPNRTIKIDGLEFAYRQLGPETGVPVVFLTHLAAVLDTVELDRRLPNSQLVLYPDAGHGGVFQFHEDFVERALEFL